MGSRTKSQPDDSPPTRILRSRGEEASPCGGYQIPITSREPIIHQPLYKTRDLHSYQPTGKANFRCLPQKPSNSPAVITVSCINKNRGHTPYPKRNRENSSIRRYVIQRGRSKITKREPAYLEWESNYVELPKTGCNSPIDNRSGVYYLRLAIQAHIYTSHLYLFSIFGPCHLILVEGRTSNMNNIHEVTRHK